MASTTITGLTAGETCSPRLPPTGATTVQTTASGTYPSFPGFYDLFVSLDGASPITFAGVDRFPGSSTPHDVDLMFTAMGPTETVALSQFSSGSSQQSPICSAVSGCVDAGNVDLGDAGAWLRRARLCPRGPNAQKRGLLQLSWTRIVSRERPRSWSLAAPEAFNPYLSASFSVPRRTKSGHGQLSIKGRADSRRMNSRRDARSWLTPATATSRACLCASSAQSTGVPASSAGSVRAGSQSVSK